MEKIKDFVVRLMNRAVHAYLKRNNVKVVVVAGSIGKTSTTNAVRTVLAQKYKVHQPKTAYNTNKSVHLELFDLPFATSTSGWVKMVATVLWRSMGKAPYEVAVIEIGTDHPGELASFAWLKPEIGVLTAIAPEHMEYFKTIDAVAKEELVVAEFCNQLICNANAVGRAYAAGKQIDIAWYGKGTDAVAENYRIQGTEVRADFSLYSKRIDGLVLQVLGEHSLDALTAAAVVAVQYGLDIKQIAAGISNVKPVKGRMQRLGGIKQAVIIDDSYNASPEAVKAALDVLGQFKSSQRIAVLGMMNEMGDYSAQAHAEVGSYCNPNKVDLVVTLGPDANEYLAVEAEKRGCTVRRFKSPYEVGTFLKQNLEAGSVVLVKGSQNGVFAEEAIKSILADPADSERLVRQSPYWMERKAAQFGEAPAV